MVSQFNAAGRLSATDPECSAHPVLLEHKYTFGHRLLLKQQNIPRLESGEDKSQAVQRQCPVSSQQSSSVQYVVNQPLCPSAECLFVRVHQSGVSVGVPHNQRVSVHARLNFQCPPSPLVDNEDGKGKGGRQ